MFSGHGPKIWFSLNPHTADAYMCWAFFFQWILSRVGWTNWILNLFSALYTAVFFGDARKNHKTWQQVIHMVRFITAKDREQKQQEKYALKSREVQHRLPRPFVWSYTGILSSSKLQAHLSLRVQDFLVPVNVRILYLLCNQPQQLKLRIPTMKHVCAKQPDNPMCMTRCPRCP